MRVYTSETSPEGPFTGTLTGPNLSLLQGRYLNRPQKTPGRGLRLTRFIGCDSKPSRRGASALLLLSFTTFHDTKRATYLISINTLMCTHIQLAVIDWKNKIITSAKTHCTTHRAVALDVNLLPRSFLIYCVFGGSPG